MAAIRATAAALLIFLAAAAAAQECDSASRAIGTRGDVPELVAGPTAWNGTLLAVVKTETGAPASLWLALYSETLEPLVGDRLIVTDATADGPAALFWNGTEFNVVYRSNSERIHLQRLTAFGEPIGGPVVINPDRRARGGDEVEAVWSAALDATVVVQHIASGVSRGIYVTLVERSGVLRSDRRLITNPTFSTDIDVAVTASGVIGVFFVSEDDGKLWLATIEPGVRVPHVAATGLGGEEVQVTSHGDVFAVARLEGEEEEAEIHWFVINTEHAIVVEDDVIVESSEGSVVKPLGLVSAGGELALTYVGRRRMRLRRMTITGETISDAPFATTDLIAGSAISEHPPVWTGTSYLSAAVREISLTSYLVRYCPLRVEITAPAIVPVNEPVLLVGTVTGGDEPYEVEWTISRDPGGPRRQEAVLRTFEITGTRTLTFTVVDGDGNTATATVTIEVTDIPPPPPPPPARRRSVRH